MTTQSLSKWETAGVIGGGGMLGSDLVNFLGDKYRKVDAITRENYESLKGRGYDLLVNANGNSKRFWANEHPYEDFLASTVSAYKSLFDFGFGKYVYISSSDVYERHDLPAYTAEDREIDPTVLSPYGFHMYISELIVRRHAKDHLILRCSMILGSNLKKGPFYDLLDGKPLFITPDSELQIVTTAEIANVIGFLVDKSLSGEIFNVGGIGTFSFRDINKYFHEEVSIYDGAERQVYEMDVSKTAALYPLRKSAEYLEDFLRGRQT